MMTELYKYKITSYIDSKKYEEKNEKIQLLRNKRENTIKIDFIFCNDASFSSSDFKVYFYEEIKKLFTPLEIEYSNGTFSVINKEEIYKKLDDLTFEYLKKYPTKVKEVNLILARTKEGLKYENLEQEIEEGSILPYLFRIDKIKNIGNAAVETQTSEIYSDWNIPTVVTYITEKLDDLRIKINFKELLNEKKSHPNKIKGGFREILKIPVNERFDFDFSIKGYYIYNKSLDIVEKIKVDKEVHFYNVTTRTERILELLSDIDDFEKETEEENKKGFEKLFVYLEDLKKDYKINRAEIEELLKSFSDSEKDKILEQIRKYLQENNIQRIKFDTGAIWTGEDVYGFFEENVK